MVLCWEGRVHEANYLCCTLVPRVPIEVETDWLIRKGSLLQKQCLLWSQAPLPVAIVAGARLPAHHPASLVPTLLLNFWWHQNEAFCVACSLLLHSSAHSQEKQLFQSSEEDPVMIKMWLQASPSFLAGPLSRELLGTPTHCLFTHITKMLEMHSHYAHLSTCINYINI